MYVFLVQFSCTSPLISKSQTKKKNLRTVPPDTLPTIPVVSGQRQEFRGLALIVNGLQSGDLSLPKKMPYVPFSQLQPGFSHTRFIQHVGNFHFFNLLMLPPFIYWLYMQPYLGTHKDFCFPSPKEASPTHSCTSQVRRIIHRCVSKKRNDSYVFNITSAYHTL